MKVIVEIGVGPTSVAATSPDFPNVVAIGSDREDALRRFRNSPAEYIAWRREDGRPLDLPSNDRSLDVIELEVAAA